jgi:hypothetical protein
MYAYKFAPTGLKYQYLIDGVECQMASTYYSATHPQNLIFLIIVKASVCMSTCSENKEEEERKNKKVDRLCGLVVRVPGYRTEMYCVSCEVRTECICYIEESRPPIWSSGQSFWIQIQRSGFDSRPY